MMKKYVFFPIQVTLQEDGLYRAECTALENCWCDAETLEQAIVDIQDIIKLCLRNDGVSDAALDSLACASAPPLSLSLPIEVA